MVSTDDRKGVTLYVKCQWWQEHGKEVDGERVGPDEIERQYAEAHPARAALAGTPGAGEAEHECANMDALQEMLIEWGRATFPRATEAGVLAHLHNEVNTELHPGCDPSEYADVVILAFQGASMRGLSLYTEILKKHAINLDREWGEENAEGFIEHVKPAPPPATEPDE